MEDLSKKKDIMKHVNPALTAQAQLDPKYQKFKQWLLDNGAFFDSVDFPCIYGEGLMGIGA